MCFREDMVDTIQDVGPIEQGFEYIDLRAFDIHLEKTDVFIQVFEIPDEIHLLDLDGFLFTEIAVAGDDRTRLGIQGGVPIEPSVPANFLVPADRLSVTTMAIRPLFHHALPFTPLSDRETL